MQRLKPEGVEEREVSQGRYILRAQACANHQSRSTGRAHAEKSDSTNMNFTANRGNIGTETRDTTNA